MASGELCADSERQVRSVKFTQQENGQPLGTAFELDKDHKELSVTSIERVSSKSDLFDQLRDVRDAMSNGDLTPGSSALFAILKTGSIHSHMAVSGLSQGMTLRVHHEPDGNVGHCMVYGMPPKETPLSNAVGLALLELVTPPIVKVGDLG